MPVFKKRKGKTPREIANVDNTKKLEYLCTVGEEGKQQIKLICFESTWSELIAGIVAARS